VIEKDKQCKHCGKYLTVDNASKNGVRNGKVRFRDECKSCRSFHVTKAAKGDPKKIAYQKEYHERTKQVEKYPCKTCSELCIKKYEFAFCSDKCRLMNYVDKKNDCWIWIGNKDISGYGITNIGSKKYRAHRAFYEIFKGSLEDNMLICHSCDTPSCVNPDHLWLGTHQDNMDDMRIKGRQFTRLSAYQVTKIRDAWITRYYHGLGTELCEKYGITCGHLSNIINRRIWKHI